MKTKLLWRGSIGLIIFGLILGLAWMNGRIRGQDAQIEVLTRENIKLKEEVRLLSLRLSDLIEIGHELRIIPWSNMSLRQILATTQIMIDESNQHHDIDLTPGLIKCVIEAESFGDMRAVSHKKCCGLMQLLPSTAIPHLVKMGFRVVDGDDIKSLLFVPTVNVLCGIHELVRLRTLHLSQGIDSWHVTLMSYLYGPGVPGLAYSQKIIYQREAMRERGIT